MNSITYNYYPPKNPQFYFQSSQFNKLKKYYFPYSRKSKLFWFIYANFSVVRNRFSVHENEIPLPVTLIKTIINQENSAYFFNLGTKGDEQKATVIAESKEQNFFLKFAQSITTKAFVENEAKTLKELKNTKIRTAKLINHGFKNNFSFLLTEALTAEKVDMTVLNWQILDEVLNVNQVFPLNNEEYTRAFSHGDFCPWNMLQTEDNKLVLVDWEKAGFKVLGYDLFTFIFQTSFLLSPKLSIKSIKDTNKEFIEYYFNKFEIENWQSYLVKFAESKIEEEASKTNPYLLNKYKELLTYND